MEAVRPLRAVLRRYMHLLARPYLRTHLAPLVKEVLANPSKYSPRPMRGTHTNSRKHARMRRRPLLGGALR
jgi:hypothetical protein